MACRFPNASDSTELFWEHLLNKCDAMSVIPSARFDYTECFDTTSNLPNSIYVKKGAFVSQIEYFDNNKFSISAVEARATDPHQRLALEVAHEAMYPINFAKQAVRTGVYIGIQNTEFRSMVKLSTTYAATGGALSIAANRVSYVFNLDGPSMSIDTACSSSLSALETACNAIYQGDCEQAVVIGVELILSKQGYVATCAARMLSPNGRCATFSNEADGYARGEGCGCIVLTALSSAVAERQCIHSCVKGCAVNQDGKSATLTAPNGPAQSRVIQTALDRAGISGADVNYVEAHGTGTALGDPIEVNSLYNVLCGNYRTHPLIVGAAKSNFGHLEAAAGMLGIIKAVLCIQHRQVPPNIHCEHINPLLLSFMNHIEFPIEDTIELPKSTTLHAGVSSFGFGGANAHVLLTSVAVEECVASRRPPAIEWDRNWLPWKEDNHPFIGKRVDSMGDVYCWEVIWSSQIVDYLSCHRVGSVPLVPATCYIEMVALCVAEVYGDRPFTLKAINFSKILFLQDGFQLERTVKLSLWKDGRVKIESRRTQDGEWSGHVEMELQLERVEATPSPVAIDIDALQQECSVQRINCGKAFYETISNEYQGEFRSLSEVFVGDRQLLGHTEFHSYETPEAFLRTCAWLDACSHTPMAVLDHALRTKPLYAAEVGEYFMSSCSIGVQEEVWTRFINKPDGLYDMFMYDKDGGLLASVIDGKGGVFQSEDNLVYVDEWEPLIGDYSFMMASSFDVIDLVDVKEIHQYVQSMIPKKFPLLARVPQDNAAASYLRTLRLEYPDWNIKTVVASAEQTVYEVPDCGDAELMYDNRQWKVRRLCRLSLPPFEYGMAKLQRGSLSKVKMSQVYPKQSVADNEIQVRVHSVGLNFRDVLNILDLYPGDPGFPGSDFSGTVVQRGKRVAEFSVGDRVFGECRGAFQTYSVTLPQLVLRMPPSLDFDQAATLPILCTTVHEALIHLAGLQPGQRVLIHAGTGGVGLMAIQYARKLKCDIIATCGADFKLKHLAEAGVKFISSSRDPEQFNSDMKQFGFVDVVLNSLSNDFIKYSLDWLRPNGHFCEIGKRNIWTLQQVTSYKSGVRYHVIAIDTMIQDDPPAFQQLFRQAMAFGPAPLPLKAFDMKDSVEALRYLQQAKHIGKVVIHQPTLFQAESVYVISGGLGFIGRRVAEKMSCHGASKLLLLSRGGGELPQDWLAACSPEVIQCDVSDCEQLRESVFERFAVQGVVHCAGVLDDATVANLTSAQFDAVYRSKVAGARNLDKLVTPTRLEFFVLCSSIASSFGSPGQANYAAANGELDALARRRRLEGKPYVSVNWGAWLGGGMADEGVVERAKRMGVMPLTPDTAIELLFRTLAAASTPGVVTICPLDHSKLAATPYFSNLRSKSRETTEGDGSIVAELMVLDQETMKSRVDDALRSIIKELSTSEVSPSMPWVEMGMDSLSMVEFQNLLKSRFGDLISNDVLIAYESPRQLSTYLQTQIELQASAQQLLHQVGVRRQSIIINVKDGRPSISILEDNPADRQLEYITGSLAATDALRPSAVMESLMNRRSSLMQRVSVAVNRKSRPSSFQKLNEDDVAIDIAPTVEVERSIDVDDSTFSSMEYQGQRVCHPILWQTFALISVSLVLGIAAIPAAYLYDHLIVTTRSRVPWVHTENFHAGAYIFVAAATWMLCYLVVVIALKWCVIGRYRAGRHVYGSWYFIRWWFMDRLISILELTLLQWLTRTIYLTFIYKLLGAKIPLDVIDIATFIREFDLFICGDVLLHGKVHSAVIDNRGLTLHRLSRFDRDLFEDQVLCYDRAEENKDTACAERRNARLKLGPTWILWGVLWPFLVAFTYIGAQYIVSLWFSHVPTDEDWFIVQNITMFLLMQVGVAAFASLLTNYTKFHFMANKLTATSHVVLRMFFDFSQLTVLWMRVLGGSVHPLAYSNSLPADATDMCKVQLARLAFLSNVRLVPSAGIQCGQRSFVGFRNHIEGNVELCQNSGTQTLCNVVHNDQYQRPLQIKANCVRLNNGMLLPVPKHTSSEQRLLKWPLVWLRSFCILVFARWLPLYVYIYAVVKGTTQVAAWLSWDLYLVAPVCTVAAVWLVVFTWLLIFSCYCQVLKHVVGLWSAEFFPLHSAWAELHGAYLGFAAVTSMFYATFCGGSYCMPLLYRCAGAEVDSLQSTHMYNSPGVVFDHPLVHFRRNVVLNRGTTVSAHAGQYKGFVFTHSSMSDVTVNPEAALLGLRVVQGHIATNGTSFVGASLGSKS